ncbi:cell wall hydrolase [Novosphingobium album (ex Liu et al. 2023)]|uniref:Cell wall hydrolase n=1 Tax=Novosphingobium album (ex Liu et al. 2023) TaxID=3031130 RepID=A0ABT5WMX6_9SPHN|nr:cell wall hydrolase [Novosphingobium album (ex Liu et al. 2023)]MDE8651398.1 cell wall hydrolase [Novosphingobium album (ex Liu et al. 2023)]
MTAAPSLPHELRPRDFSARFVRSGGRSLAMGRRRVPRRGKAAFALIGAIALPAFAAPGDWDRFQIGDAVQSETQVQPMPFEQAGSSFPGSAFYYLELEKPVTRIGEGDHAEGEIPGQDADAFIGPIARAMRIDNSGIDRTRAEQCLTAAIYYEAASEPDAGQRAVAQVVLNRVAHPAYPNTVCGVVYQGSERSTGCQFSFTCDGSLARRPSRLFWLRAEAVARDALAGYVYAPVGLATHYHTVQVHPYWAPSLHYLGTIGAHRFYSFAGAAGRPGAFRFAYFGGEPIAAPHRRDDSPSAVAASASLDPLLVQRTYDALLDAAPASGLTPAAATQAPVAPAPLYTNDLRERGGDSLYRGQKLPEATGIRPEYQNSGRWITSPTG